MACAGGAFADSDDAVSPINDLLGRRSSVAYSGTAFAQNHFFQWGYNDHSELESAGQFAGTPEYPGSRYAPDGELAYD